jgi:hypothetical protein
MDDLEWFTIEMLQSRKTALRNLDRALELVRAHYRSLESKPSLDPKPNSTRQRAKK